MANAFKSETQTGIGTSAVNILTCPASTEITIIGLTVANIVSTQITVDVQLAASGRTSGAEDNVYLSQFGGVLTGSDSRATGQPGDYVIISRPSNGSDGEIFELKTTLDQVAKKFSVKMVVILIQRIHYLKLTL